MIMNINTIKLNGVRRVAATGSHFLSVGSVVKLIIKMEVKKMKRIVITALGSALVLMSAGAHAEDIGYKTHIKPLFDAKCSVCHGTGSPQLPEFKKDKKKHTGMMKGPRMDSYLHLIGFIGWPDTGAVMRRLDDGKNTKDGKPGNMYQYLGSTDEEKQQNLKLFKDWVGNWTLKKWKDVTKEELDGIKVK